MQDKSIKNLARGSYLMVCDEDLSKRIFIHLKVLHSLLLSYSLLGCVMVSGEKKGFAIKTNGCLMVGWVKCELFSVKMKVIYSKSFLHPDQSSILGTYLNFIQFSLKSTTTIFTWKDWALDWYTQWTDSSVFTWCQV